MSRSRTARALLAVAVGAGVALLAPASAAETKTYTAPFAIGPAGGDTYSRTVAQADGRVVVGRVGVTPAVVGCPGGSPYASLRVTHDLVGTVREVTAAWTEAAVDPYVFVTLSVRDEAGNWLGSKSLRGPLVGDGTLSAPVTLPADPEDWPKKVVVDMGIQASGACPSANGGTVKFTSLRVSPDVAPTAAPRSPVEVQFATAAQGSLMGYLTRAVVMPQGASGRYTNLDIVRHDVVQDVKVDGFAGDGSAPWCGRFPAGKCPLFWSALIGVAEQTPVQGLSGLKAGTYSFFCTLHPEMKGKLLVQ